MSQKLLKHVQDKLADRGLDKSFKESLEIAIDRMGFDADWSMDQISVLMIFGWACIAVGMELETPGIAERMS